MNQNSPSHPPLSSNVRWTLLGSLAVAGGNWLQFIFLARSAGPVAVGRFAFALALTAPVMSFASLQMRTLLASDAAGRYAFTEYLRVTAVMTAAGLMGCLVLELAIGEGHGDWPVLGAVCAMRAADMFAEIHFGLWQRREQMRVIGVVRLAQSVVSTAAAGFAAYSGGGPAGVAAAGALGSLVGLGYLWRRASRELDDREATRPSAGGPPLEKGRLRMLALEGLPLGIVSLLSVLQANVPRYFIERSAGKGELGLFAAASQLTTAGNVLVAALGAAALPRLAGWYAAGSPSFFVLTRKLALGGAALGAAGVALSVLVGRLFLETVYGEGFGSAAGTLIVLSIASGLWFVAAFLGVALTAGRIIKAQPAILAGTLVVLVVGNAILVARHGSVGAAAALAIGSGVHALASYLFLRRLRQRKAWPE